MTERSAPQFRRVRRTPKGEWLYPYPKGRLSEFVARHLREQGVDPRIDDPEVVEKLAVLIKDVPDEEPQWLNPSD